MGGTIRRSDRKLEGVLPIGSQVKLNGYIRIVLDRKCRIQWLEEPSSGFAGQLHADIRRLCDSEHRPVGADDRSPNEKQPQRFWTVKVEDQTFHAISLRLLRKDPVPDPARLV